MNLQSLCNFIAAISLIHIQFAFSTKIAGTGVGGGVTPSDVMASLVRSNKYDPTQIKAFQDKLSALVAMALGSVSDNVHVAGDSVKPCTSWHKTFNEQLGVSCNPSDWKRINIQPGFGVLKIKLAEKDEDGNDEIDYVGDLCEPEVSPCHPIAETCTTNKAKVDCMLKRGYKYAVEVDSHGRYKRTKWTTKEVKGISGTSRKVLQCSKRPENDCKDKKRYPSRSPTLCNCK